MVSRKKQVLKNVLIAFFSNILIYILSLFTSKVIKERLGLEVLGLNGVLTNVISILSLTELGVGSAITFALYEPLASQNKELIKSIMAFYKKAYRIIACIVLFIGLCIIPIIPMFISNENFSSRYILIVYLLFLVNSVLSYLLVYKRTLIVADQKNYVITSVTLVYTYVLKLSQLFVVLYTSNYILFLIVQIVCTLIYNLVISLICDKIYPYIKEKSERLDSEHLNIIKSKIKALIFHSIGAVVVLGTDNILISYFCGIAEAGRYTSYLSIVNMVGTIIILIFDNLKDSLGNFLVTETQERKRELFNNMFFLNQSIVAVFSICLMLLLTPFVRLWFGDDTVLPLPVVISIVFCFYLQKSMLCIGSIKSSAGLFEQDRFIPIIESIINLVSSVILAEKFGVMGIILGTIISTLMTLFISNPIIVFRKIFEENPIKYYYSYLGYFIRFFVLCTLGIMLTNTIAIAKSVSLIAFFLEAIVVFFLSLIFWVLFVVRKKEFLYYVRLIIKKSKTI